jgi:spore germination cell wall hydrolase CwlJ-like protein
MNRLLIICLLASSAVADEVLTRDERVVALTILGEARGEGKTGMYAVGCVIQKRSSNRNLTSAQVCHESWQFSIWNAGKGKIKKERDLWHLWESKETAYARKLARYLCKNTIVLDDITNGADHYCTLNANPSWAKDKKPAAIIGRHKFYKLK